MGLWHHLVNCKPTVFGVLPSNFVTCGETSTKKLISSMEREVHEVGYLHRRSLMFGGLSAKHRGKWLCLTTRPSLASVPTCWQNCRSNLSRADDITAIGLLQLQLWVLRFFFFLQFNRKREKIFVSHMNYILYDDHWLYFEFGITRGSLHPFANC